jgi:hypothetical protein
MEFHPGLFVSSYPDRNDCSTLAQRFGAEIDFSACASQFGAAP